jgi:carboxyl-terminal processing protease
VVSGKSESFELRRSLVPQPSIPGAYILSPGIGYVDMSNGFSYSTSSELSSALRELHRQGMTGLIIDLRNNPGGILEEAVKVSETFLPYGSVIVTQRGRHQLDNRVWRSANRSPESIPIVVLVNNDSASASEVVAGALQDNDRALIVGERTFGKGLVQSVFDLPFSGGLTLTTAKYYTPSGRSIQRDYSNGDLYGYFNHPDLMAQAADPAKEARTSTNRRVFGGDGITPDETVHAQPPTRNQLSLIDPIFFFSRELVTGRVSDERRRTKIGTGRSDITDQLLSGFAEFGLRLYPKSVSGERIAAEKVFIKLRLRYYLILSASGSAAADKVLFEDDPQVAAALNALPRARQLALAASKLKRPPLR